MKTQAESTYAPAIATHYLLGPILQSQDEDLDRATLEAIRDLAPSWERRWPAFLEEFKERAARRGLTVEELAAALSARLHWHHACDA